MSLARTAASANFGWSTACAHAARSCHSPSPPSSHVAPRRGSLLPRPVPVTRDDAAPTAHVPVPALFQVLFPVEAGVDVRDAGEFGVCEVDEGSRAHRTQRVVLVALVGGRTRVVRVVRVVAIEICHGEWERVLLLLLLRVLLGRVLALALAVPRHRIFEVILERILPTRRGVPVEGRPDPATFGGSPVGDPDVGTPHRPGTALVTSPRGETSSSDESRGVIERRANAHRAVARADERVAAAAVTAVGPTDAFQTHRTRPRMRRADVDVLTRQTRRHRHLKKKSAVIR